MNLLYIGTFDSIHDLKWMSSFSNNDEHSVYFVCESDQLKESDSFESIRAKYKKDNIHFLGTLEPYSIKSSGKFKKSGNWLKSQIEEHNIDLVHILFATPFALWSEFIGRPVIITTRGSDVLRVLPELKQTKGIKGLYFNALFKRFRNAFRTAAAVTSTSKAQAEQCVKLFNTTSPTIVRTGVDVERIRSLDRPDLISEKLSGKPYIFSPRFMSPVYDIELQIEAIEQLPETIINEYQFLFVRGKQFDEAYFKKCTHRLETLQKEINLDYVVVDYFDQETLWMTYKKAALTIMTPVSDGTPNSALEAMSAQCKLIIPDLNYDAVLFEGTSLVLKNRSAQSLAQLIEHALNDYPQEMLEEAFERVQLHGNRSVEMKKLSEIYHQIHVSK